jgi:hypothetical protein
LYTEYVQFQTRLTGLSGHNRVYLAFEFDSDGAEASFQWDGVAIDDVRVFEGISMVGKCDNDVVPNGNVTVLPEICSILEIAEMNPTVIVSALGYELIWENDERGIQKFLGNFLNKKILYCQSSMRLS